MNLLPGSHLAYAATAFYFLILRYRKSWPTAVTGTPVWLSRLQNDSFACSCPGMPLLSERNMFQGTPIYICWSNTLKDNINSSLQQYFNWIFLLSNWKNSWNNLGRIKAIDNICIVAIETLCDKNNENENYRGKQWHSNKQKSWNVLAAVLF